MGNFNRWRCDLYAGFSKGAQEYLSETDTKGDVGTFGTFYFSIPSEEAKKKDSLRDRIKSYSSFGHRVCKEMAKELTEELEGISGPDRRVAMIVARNRMDARAKLWARGWRSDDVRWDGEVIPGHQNYREAA